MTIYYLIRFINSILHHLVDNMRVTEKGQVTIPLEIRERYGFLPHTEVEDKGKMYFKLLITHNHKSTRGKNIVAHLRGKATVKMTTEEIMRLTRGDT